MLETTDLHLELPRRGWHWITVTWVLAAICLPAQTGVAQSDDSPEAGEVRADTETSLDRESDDVGQPRTLEQLTEFARDNAPELLQARERLGLGDAAVEEANRFQPFNPELEAKTGVGVDGPGVSKIEIELKQRLEIAGERGHRIEAARGKSAVREAQLARTRWQLVTEVRRLYWRGLTDRRRVAIERQSVEFGRELFEMARERFEAGEEPRTSVVVSKAELATTRQQLAAARVEWRRTMRDLEAEIGWSDEEPPRPSGDLPEPTPPRSKNELLEDALEHDRELALLRSRLARAEAEATLAEVEVWPNPVAGLGYERENMGTPRAEDKVLFSVGVPLPLWDRNQGEISRAKTRAKMYEQAIESREIELESRVASHLETVESAYEQAKIYEEEVLPAFATQLDLLKEGFELGQMSLLDVMNARDRLLDVQRKHLDALEQYYTSMSELERVAGTPLATNDDR